MNTTETLEDKVRRYQKGRIAVDLGDGEWGRIMKIEYAKDNQGIAKIVFAPVKNRTYHATKRIHQADRYTIEVTKWQRFF